MNLDLIGAAYRKTDGPCTARPAASRRIPRAKRPHAGQCRVHLVRALGVMQTKRGFRVRGGRFLPAYGVRFADHNTFTRIDLDLDRNDQVYGVEVSGMRGPSLVQVMVSAGEAEAILHDYGHRGFSTAGRWQFDLSRTAIVGSGFYRHRPIWIRHQARSAARSASRQRIVCRSGLKWTRTCRRRREAVARGSWSTRRRWRPIAGFG